MSSSSSTSFLDTTAHGGFYQNNLHQQQQQQQQQNSSTDNDDDERKPAAVPLRSATTSSLKDPPPPPPPAVANSWDHPQTWQSFVAGLDGYDDDDNRKPAAVPSSFDIATSAASATTAAASTTATRMVSFSSSSIASNSRRSSTASWEAANTTTNRRKRGRDFMSDLIDLCDDDSDDDLHHKNKKPMSDYELAKRLQEEECSIGGVGSSTLGCTGSASAGTGGLQNHVSQSLKLQHDADLQLAQRLQRKEDELESQTKARLMEEKDMMLSTSTGKAFKLAEAVLEKVDFMNNQSSTSSAYASIPEHHATTDTSNNNTNFKDSRPFFEAVAKDDMVYTAERSLKLKAGWKDQMMKDGNYTPWDFDNMLKFDMGFHYTKPRNLDTIRTDGLLSRSERTAQNIGLQRGGEFFGGGIYTANNPFAFTNFGSVGLIVARLQGSVSSRENTYNMMHSGSGSNSTETLSNNSFNTIVGNKTYSPGNQIRQLNEENDEIVLKTSAQVIPLVKFDLEDIQRYNPSSQQNVEKIWDMVEQLGAVLDEFCNDGHNDDTKPLNVVHRMTWDEYRGKTTTSVQSLLAKKNALLASLLGQANASIQPSVGGSTMNTQTSSLPPFGNPASSSLGGPNSGTISSGPFGSTGNAAQSVSASNPFGAPTTASSSLGSWLGGNIPPPTAPTTSLKTVPNANGGGLFGTVPPASTMQGNTMHGGFSFGNAGAFNPGQNQFLSHAAQMNPLFQSNSTATPGSFTFGTASAHPPTQSQVGAQASQTNTNSGLGPPFFTFGAPGAQPPPQSQVGAQSSRSSTQGNTTQIFIASLQMGTQTSNPTSATTAAAAAAGSGSQSTNQASAATTTTGTHATNSRAMARNINQIAANRTATISAARRRAGGHAIARRRVAGRVSHVQSASNGSSPAARVASTASSSIGRHGVDWPAISWQTDNDYESRKEVMTKLVDWLKIRSDSLQLLNKTKSAADFAKEVEEGLYLSAKNLAEYKDLSTLSKRLIKTLDTIYSLERAPVVPERTLQYVAIRSMEKEVGRHLQNLTEDDLKKAAADDCVICLDSLVLGGSNIGVSSAERRRLKLVKLPCGHMFHKGCILDCAKQLSCRCPMKCSKTIGPMRGKCPSGSMKITYNKHVHCSGYHSVGTIVILYHIPRAKQFKYHPTPGKKHSGATRTCYLPDNMEGNELLRRLEYAWANGLTFTVGTSLTTGASDQVTWASIHHKTRTSGGSAVHGFPDNSYFDNCNAELDSLGVPSSSDLIRRGSNQP